MNIQELQTERLDINNKYNVELVCKQFDDVILKIIVYDKSLPADLSDYNVRLKAFKANQVPLIQNTNISIKDNSVTIKASKQLTTTQGIVKAELQFINKTTLEKKSTFYINIEIVASVLDVDGIVSTPTCTILEEIDHKLDQIENIGEVLDEAKEVRDTLTNKTIPAATNINSKLETSTKNASTKITEVESIISSAYIKIEEVETCINNADFSKKELDLSKTNADISKENLDAANTLAEKNIEELNSLGNVTDLAKNVQTNTTDIANLKEKVEDNTSQLKDCAKKLSQLSNPNIIINGEFQFWQRGTEMLYTDNASSYLADRWRVHHKNTHMSKQPTNNNISNNCIRIVNKGTESGQLYLMQAFEDYLIEYLENSTMTLSFWIKGYNSNNSLGCRIGSTGGKTIKLSNDWQKVTLTTLSVSFDKDKVYNRGLLFYSTSAATFDNNSGFDITNVKLELGSVATPFIPRSYGEEEMLCKRYYRTTPYQQVFRMSYHTNDLVVFEYPIGTDMRTTPTIVGKPNVDIQLATLTGSTIEDCTFSITKTSNGLSIGANKTNHGCTDGILVIKNSCGFDSEMY